MDFILEGFRQAFFLILSLDQEVLGIAFLSLWISTAAILLASVIGVPLGFVIGTTQLPGKHLTITFFNTLISFPTVVVGLLVFAFISRQGPLGFLGILFSPTAMIIGQFILAIPIITALTISAVQGVDQRAHLTALTLGANHIQTSITVLNEARFALVAAIIAGFGRVIGEVGSAIMLGGNIRNYTRTITTAIALETSKGDFGFAIALGIILMVVSFAVNILFRYFQQRGS
ncbi:MAG: transporter permease [Deltaproteobacteria bacterium]|jgi:tungstate transport system permease protein|nr:transporter permease [Deltaproteobacteria bacterium]